MRFIDEVTVRVVAGNGGNGRVSFRREKFVPRGGPDGGDGGDGGSIYLKATEGQDTLVRFRGKKIYRATDGEDGGRRHCHGKRGGDLIIPVPVGTVVKNAATNQVVADLLFPNATCCVATGGRGGLGNDHFKSPTCKAPKQATPGMRGLWLDLNLELKLLADISLIGMPNVGKSTLISTISRARPKIGNYDFTSLEPSLGVVDSGDHSFVVADIPGLIEGASQGRGLGTKFLKHMERTKAFVHMVDISLAPRPAQALNSYRTVKSELGTYGGGLLNKKEIVCLSKADARSENDIREYRDFFQRALGRSVLPISSASQKNIDVLKHLMLNTLKGGVKHGELSFKGSGPHPQ